MTTAKKHKWDIIRLKIVAGLCETFCFLNISMFPKKFAEGNFWKPE